VYIAENVLFLVATGSNCNGNYHATIYAGPDFQLWGPRIIKNVEAPISIKNCGYDHPFLFVISYNDLKIHTKFSRF
jgi:hypothetical protein